MQVSYLEPTDQEEGYTVYILRTFKGKFYVGCTTNLNARIGAHVNGEVSFTTDKLPIELVSAIYFTDRRTAFKFEKYLKSGSGRAFLYKRLIPDKVK